MSASYVMPNVAARMRWLQSRSQVISENIANADTPRFSPKDLTAPGAGGMALAATRAGHIGAGRASGSLTDAARFETRPSGNAVSLEDEMLKLSETQLEYQMLSGLYQRSLTRLRTAIGKRG